MAVKGASACEYRKDRLMTKRIVSLFIALVIPMAFMFTGCKGGGKPLTIQEYLDTLTADVKDYTAAAKELSAIDSTTFTDQAVKARHDKAKDVCGKMSKALDKFADITPPQDYSEKHKTLLKAVEEERKFVKATEKLLTSTDIADVEAAKNELETIYNLPTEQNFAAVALDIIKELKAAQ